MKKRLLALILTLVMVVSILPGSVLAVDENVTSVSTSDDSPIQITKQVVDDGDGNLSLQIEAWATGKKTVTQNVKPVDIVLVLDQSGSMAKGTGDVSYTYTAASGQNWSYHDVADSWHDYYVQVNDEYYLVRAVREGDWGNRQYSLMYHNGTEDVLLGGPSDDRYSDIYSGTLYTRRANSVTKLSALKDAVGQFVSTVNQNSPTDGEVHRIAIVGFASGYRYNWQTYSYNNSELFVGDTQYRYNGGSNEYHSDDEYAAQNHYSDALQASNSQNLTDSINALSADGGTLTNLGMEMANGILNTVNNSERKKVIIVFTDG